MDCFFLLFQFYFSFDKTIKLLFLTRTNLLIYFFPSFHYTSITMTLFVFSIISRWICEWINTATQQRPKTYQQPSPQRQRTQQLDV